MDMPASLPVGSEPVPSTADALQTAPWVPFRFLTIDGTHRSLYVKSHFSDDSYVLLVTDLKRVWQETATKADVEQKMKIYARAFSETPISKILPYLSKYVQEPQADVKYFATWEPDELGQLHVVTQGSIGKVPFKWTWKCDQLHTQDLEPEHTPGHVLFNHVTEPLLTMVGEQERRIQSLMSQLATKEKELVACHELMSASRVKFPPKRSKAFDATRFVKENDEEYRTRLVDEQLLPQTAFTLPLYKSTLTRFDPSARDAHAEADISHEAPIPTLPRANTLLTGPIASIGMYGGPSLSSPMDEVALDGTGKTKKELQLEEEMRRRHERDENLKKYKAEMAEKAKKKKRKLV
ncbi:hypothetical protein DFS34DRAFT_494316 [Phlyctochytrium arcticum]|nr:hypothetical protein DFS34DRAFT_494316 [Phlyctochytrium arcticum]